MQRPEEPENAWLIRGGAPRGAGGGLKYHYVTVCLRKGLAVKTLRHSQKAQGQARPESQQSPIHVIHILTPAWKWPFPPSPDLHRDVWSAGAEETVKKGVKINYFYSCITFPLNAAKHSGCKKKQPFSHYPGLPRRRLHPAAFCLWSFGNADNGKSSIQPGLAQQ